MLTNREIFLKHLAQTSDNPLMIEPIKAEGIFIFDIYGKKYTDLISGISVSSTGHRHPQIIEAIKKQCDYYLHLMVYGEYVQTPQTKLAKAICDLLPKELNSVYFVNSGSEAVEGALKLARKVTSRKKIIAFHNAYHGSTFGALSVMGNEDQKCAFEPLVPEVEHIAFNNLSELEKIDCATACVIIEPIQGEAGIIAADIHYLKALRAKCTEIGCLLIFDEIQTGLGRTGKWFAFEHYDITPDILLLAKAFGGGMPLGAFISSKENMQTLAINPALGHITTFGGHPVSCAAALANIEVLKKESLVEQVEEKGKIFERQLKHARIKAFRRRGLFMALEFDSFETLQKIIQTALHKGVITDWFLFNVASMRIAPPLTITSNEIEEACNIILEAIAKIEDIN